VAPYFDYGRLGTGNVRSWFRLGASARVAGCHGTDLRSDRRSFEGRGTSRSYRSQRWRSSWATSAGTSRDQPSAVLKATTRTGSLYCPSIRSRMTASRSVPSALASGLPRGRRVIVNARHDRGRPTRLSHETLHATEPGTQLKSATTCSGKHWRVCDHWLLSMWRRAIR